MREQIGDWLEGMISGAHQNLEETEALFKVMGSAALAIGNASGLYYLIWEIHPRAETLQWLLPLNAFLLYVFVPWTRVPPLRGRTVELPESLGLGLKFGWLFCAGFASALVYETPSMWWVLLLPGAGGLGAIAIWLGKRWGSALVVTASFWVWVGVPVIAYFAEGDFVDKAQGILQYLGVALPAAAIGILAHRQGEVVE